VHFPGIADHAKQGFILCFTVNIPGGIENLVPTVLGISLSEHHQLNIRGITLK
jgi:phosphoribosyl-dephospho-CoA transferase